MTMKQRILGLLIWLVIVGAIGAFARYALGINFWVAAIVAGLALISNGLVAEWEDRQPGGFYNPRSGED
jgi:hypothetical protein